MPCVTKTSKYWHVAKRGRKAREFSDDDYKHWLQGQPCALCGKVPCLRFLTTSATPRRLYLHRNLIPKLATRQDTHMLDGRFFDIEAEYLYCERWGKEEEEESEHNLPARAKE